MRVPLRAGGPWGGDWFPGKLAEKACPVKAGCLPATALAAITCCAGLWRSITLPTLRATMRAVIQRVLRARVVVDQEVVGQIEGGLVVLLGIAHADTADQARWLADK